MKRSSTVLFCLLCLRLFALQCQSFGPETGTFATANFGQDPISMVGTLNSQNEIYIFDGNTWESYLVFPYSLPVTSICNLNDNDIMITMGMMTYSDGLYNFNRTTHTCTINYWFMLPNFIKYNRTNSTYYVGERDGLFKSTTGTNWSRITSLGNSACTSMACFNEYMVANNGQNVYYSLDAGLSWSPADTANLKGFRYMSNDLLYAVMNNGSDSDGLWRSMDYGATWNAVYYTEGLSLVGPDYGNSIPLGWNRPQGETQVGLWNTSTQQVTMLDHPSLYYPVRELEIFPLVNTPSFYVINATGCFFVTDFLSVETDEQLQIPSPTLRVYPNPVTQDARISFSLDQSSQIGLDIYNVRGQKVRSLHQGMKDAGDLTLTWDGRDDQGRACSNGTYIVQMSANGSKRSAKLLLMK